MQNLNMKAGIVCLLVMVASMVSCKKEHSNSGNPVSVPVPVSPKKVLLKDITIPNIPSPFYHFEYAPDSSVSRISFSSDFSIYDVFYNGNRVSEMRDNIIVNHDTLRYSYDNAGNVSMITFIKAGGPVFRHALFTYAQNQLRQINWDHLDAVAGFIVDRTVTLTYFPDGNLQELVDHRPAHGIVPDDNSSTQFSDYDDKVNVDGFTLLQDGYHDHVFLLPGIRIQKNNARKEVFTGENVFYTGTYTYTYNPDGTPSARNGSILFTQGTGPAQVFQDSKAYSYY